MTLSLRVAPARINASPKVWRVPPALVRRRPSPSNTDDNPGGEAAEDFRGVREQALGTVKRVAERRSRGHSAADG